VREDKGKRERRGGGEEREGESHFPDFVFAQFILHTVYYRCWSEAICGQPPFRWWFRAVDGGLLIHGLKNKILYTHARKDPGTHLWMASRQKFNLNPKP
jgi:hypothetical protein